MDITEIEEIAKSYFGNDLVWYCDKSLYIQFPEIVISNTRKETHVIKDLIVQIEFTSSLNRLVNIRGTRVTRTVEEQNTGYSHSHLTSYKNMARFSAFCLGHSPLATIVNTITADDLNTDNFEMLCTILDRYVRHESIEGGPYLYIRDIKNVRSTHTPSLYVPESINALNYLFKRKCTPKGHLFIAEYYTVFDITDEDIDNYLKETLGSMHFYRYMIKMQTPVKTIYYKPNSAQLGGNTLSSVLIGEREFKPKIIKNESNKRESTQRLVHYEFRLCVKNAIFSYIQQRRALPYNITNFKTYQRVF